MKADAQLDCLGLYCPLPIIQTMEKVHELAEGEILEILSDDRGIVSDMPAWCKSTGHEFLGIEEHDGEYHVFIRKRTR